MDHSQLKTSATYSPRPHGGAARVLIVLAVLPSIAAKAGLVSIPMALILTSWLFKYAYILFDHTVRGFDEPPTLDIPDAESPR
jgi:hypothetical protein